MKEKNINKKEICSACGAAPVNHTMVFIVKLINENLYKIFGGFFNSPSGPRWQYLANFIELKVFNVFGFFNLVRFSDDIEKACSGRSKVIWEEANRRGIKMQQLVLFGKYIEHYKVKINKEEFIFQSLPIPFWLPQKGYEWVDNKVIFAKKLKEVGVASPATRKISTIKDLRLAFESLSKPIIIKPQSGSRSRHTTTNINTIEEAQFAFKLARQITPTMLAQEHLFGSVYRATVVNNKLVGFFKADPPQVTGDNVHTIKELIKEKNKNRPERISEILINEELLNFIKRQNYTLESILNNGSTIDLIAKTGRNYGGYTKEMLKDVHPKMYEIFKKAGEVVSIPVAGFDLIIEDPTLDPDMQRWGVIECNSLPFIDLHYFAFEGEPVNIAKYVWDLWDKKV